VILIPPEKDQYSPVKKHEKMFSDIPKQSDDSYISHNVVPYSALPPPPPHIVHLPPRKASVADFFSNIFEDFQYWQWHLRLFFIKEKNTVSLCGFFHTYMYIPLAAKVPGSVAKYREISTENWHRGRQTWLPLKLLSFLILGRAD
jgi:hypothetical protein